MRFYGGGGLVLEESVEEMPLRYPLERWESLYV